MTIQDPDEPRPTPRDTAESEEQELAERIAAEHGAGGDRAVRADDDDPREEEGWTQPESSAQKGATPDLG